MLDSNGKRMLAYIQEVGSIEPLFFCKKDEKGNFVPDLNEKGEKVYADAIEKAHVLGWDLVIKKGEFKPGDKCVFFEIDSKVPEGKFLNSEGEDVFAFLAQKHYSIKTYKLNKFGVWSQGLILPLSAFNIDPNIELNTDMTETLGVTYAIKEDNHRKASDPALDRFKKYKAEHPKFYSNKLIKWLMKFNWFFNLQVRLHGGKRAKKYGFPTQYVSKTDEERVQNMPWILEDKTPLIVTEKIDGTSTTVLVERLSFERFKTYICSRNVCYGDGKNNLKDKKVFENKDNIYLEMAAKYKMVEHLTNYLKAHPRMKWACIQGESYGEGWQGNPLKLSTHEFAAFNFKDSINGRMGSIEGKAMLAEWGIPWVPIIHTDYVLPDSVDELLLAATGPSTVNPSVLREGWVLRGKDGQLSFKAVSPEYLMKHNI